MFSSGSKDKVENTSQKWRSEVVNLINNKAHFQTIQNNIANLTKEKGICEEFRSEVWAFLIGNPLRINRNLFYIIFNKAVQTFSSDSLIKKDIDRTFFYFSKNETFTKILAEASILLQMFTVSLKDLPAGHKVHPRDELLDGHGVVGVFALSSIQIFLQPCFDEEVFV